MAGVEGDEQVRGEQLLVDLSRDVGVDVAVLGQERRGPRVGGVADVPGARAGTCDPDPFGEPGLLDLVREDLLGDRGAADVPAADERDVVAPGHERDGSGPHTQNVRPGSPRGGRSVVRDRRPGSPRVGPSGWVAVPAPRTGQSPSGRTFAQRRRRARRCSLVSGWGCQHHPVRRGWPNGALPAPLRHPCRSAGCRSGVARTAPAPAPGHGAGAGGLREADAEGIRRTRRTACRRRRPSR